MRKGTPAKQLSPRKSPGPSSATTASLPTLLTTESFTPPFWIYITVAAMSPCEYSLCDLRYSTIVLATPADSRKAWALNERTFGVLNGNVIPFGLVPAFISILCMKSSQGRHSAHRKKSIRPARYAWPDPFRVLSWPERKRFRLQQC